VRAIARAKPARRRIPPESCAGSFFSAPSRWTRSRHSPTRAAIRSRGQPARRSGNATFSQTVIESKSAPSWNAMPKRRRKVVISR